MSAGAQDNSRNLRNRIEGYARWITALAGAAVVIWSIFKFFIPVGDVDLTIWIQQEIPIVIPELPAAASQLSLSLTYDEEPISSATILDVNIFNSGSKPIGDQGPWQLALKTQDGARLVLLGQPETNPANLDLQLVDGSQSDALTLQLGLLNRDDSIKLRLLVIEPANIEQPAIVAETRVPNLRAPFVTRRTEVDRLLDAFVTPLLLITLAGWVIAVVWYQRKIVGPY